MRTILSARVSAFPENLFYLEICGDGFLYNMVRIIAGTVVGVIEGRFEPRQIEEMLLLRERKRAGMTAPPHGLYLYKVSY